MTQQSNTPETDANSITWDRANRAGCDADFARKLERERDEARLELANCKSHFAIHDGKELDEKIHMAVLHALSERDQLRKVADELAQYLESCTPDVPMGTSKVLKRYAELPHVIARKEPKI